GVHAGPERRQETDAPIAELVAKALDGEAVVGGQGADRLALLGDVADQVGGGAPIEAVVALEPSCRRRALLGDGAHEGAERAPELDGPPRPLAAPERQLARLAGRRGHDDPVARDLLDAPRRGAEEEGLPGAALVHHLLVELADARPAL